MFSFLKEFCFPHSLPLNLKLILMRVFTLTVKQTLKYCQENSKLWLLEEMRGQKWDLGTVVELHIGDGRYVWGVT